jgi:TPR repeat protein
MYAYGKGVFRDYSRAHMWFSNAASFSQDYAEQSRYNLEKKMSRVDIGKAQKMRWRCRTSNYKNC